MKTLVVLAGGKSTRMGKDKVFLHISNGETFLEHLLRIAEGLFDRIIISAGNDAHAQQIRTLLAERSLQKAEVIPDRYPECGPMGGLVSVYEAAGAEKFAVIAADMPKADLEIVSFLYDRCGEDSCLLRNDAGKEEPLIGAYGANVLRNMQTLLAEGRRRLRDALTEGSVTYSAEEIAELLPGKSAETIKKEFRNINTAEDYRENIQ